MKKVIFTTIIVLVLIACNNKETPKNSSYTKIVINEILNQWHKDVAEYNYEAYFNKMTNDAVFVGTDASEVWSKQEFQDFSKSHFDKKQTWDFKPVSRNIYLDKTKQTAWFDELLDTWMGVCRGSGVMVKTDKEWKIQHYVLSVAVPNEDIKAVVTAKKEKDSLFLIKHKIVASE